MVALDRKARIALVAAVAAVGVVGWYVMRRGGTTSSPRVDEQGSAGDVAVPAGGSDREAGTPVLRRGAPAVGLRSRAPGPPAQVTGVVRLAGAGTPVAGAEVAFMNDTGETTVTADGAGRYTIEVASGVRWKVHARTDDAVGYPETFEATGATAVRDLEVARLVTIEGNVVDGQGAVVGGADVNVEVAGADRNLIESAVTLSTQSDAGGRFSLRALAGTSKLRASRGMMQGLATVGPVAAGATVATTIRVQAPVRVRGVVVDGERRPQPGATVKALAALEPGVYEKKTLTAGSDGRFDVELPAGWVRLEASTPTGERAPVWNQTVVAGARLDDVQLVVSAGEELRGTVKTADGTPVVGARVRLVAGGSSSTYDASTGGDGHFTIAVPERTAYLVKVRHSEGYVQRQVEAWGDDEAFVMPRFGALRIKVAGAAGDARLAVESFVPAGEGAPRAPADVSFRGSKDAIEVDSMEPGHYRLTVTAPGAGAAAVEVDVPPAGVGEASVDLSAKPDGKLGLRGAGARDGAGARGGGAGARGEGRPC